MDTATKEAVRRRAGERCEYCRLRQTHSDLKHHVEHIIAKQHGGSDDLDNLALACHRCNLHKGPNLTGIDPSTGEVASIFHPRIGRWPAHFTFEGVRILGITAVGRATVQVLSMNDARRLELRAEISKFEPLDCVQWRRSLARQPRLAGLLQITRRRLANVLQTVAFTGVPSIHGFWSQIDLTGPRSRTASIKIARKTTHPGVGRVRRSDLSGRSCTYPALAL